MPDRIRKSGGEFIRAEEAATIMQYLQAFECCSIVGISNIGKSDLLRTLVLPELSTRFHPQADPLRLVYVDCNRMLSLSDQGFYELVLRCLLDLLHAQEAPAGVLEQLDRAYQALIKPHSPFHVPLSFNQGLTAVLDQLETALVLIFDEFDDVLERVDSRVFLNLRALKDQYRRRLVYVTATNLRLAMLRRDLDVDEFTELFAHATYYLPPLSPADATSFIQKYAHDAGVTFNERDVAFLWEWAGGHVGLLEAACNVLGSLTGAPARDESQDWIIHREAASVMPRSLIVQTECSKIWNSLNDDERQTLLDLLTPGGEPATAALASLRQKHVLLGTSDETARAFCRLFTLYLQQQNTLARPGAHGLRVDVETGEVYVDGHRTEVLTNLEYRLLLLLYGQIGKICDKYEVVETVWGQDYIDTVDDARIEKLVSRLRAKIEPDPSSPRYILTIRGRGYKLAGPT